MTDLKRINRRPSPTIANGNVVDDDPRYYIDKKVFKGFKSVSITLPLMSLCRSFSMVLTDKWQVDQEDFQIKTGLRSECYLGENPVIDSYIDSMSIALREGSRNITIGGRCRTQDVVDCSVTKTFEYLNAGILEIAQDICKPFNVRVTSELSDLGDKFDKVTVKQGETCFELLLRLARMRKLVMISTATGDIVIERIGQRRSKTALIEGENVKTAILDSDNSDRFSEYQVKGQSNGLVGNPQDSTSSLGKAFDKGIKRFRPTILQADGSSDTDSAQSAAEFESSIRASKSLSVKVVVQNWRRKDGQIWSQNEIVPVDIPSVGIKRDMLISNVTFQDDNDGGKITTLELLRKDALEFKPEMEESSDPLSGLGWG